MKNSLFYRIIKFTTQHAVVIFIIVCCLTAFFAYNMLSIEINPEVGNLIPEEEKITRINQKYDPEGNLGEYMVIAVNADDPFIVEGLQALYQAGGKIEELDLVKSIIEPMSLTTFFKEGKKLAIKPMSPHGKAPETEEELEIFRDRLLQDPFARKLVVSDDGKTLSIVISLYKTEDYAQFMKEINSIVETLEPYYSTHLAGHPVLSENVKRFLIRDLKRLLGFAVLMIIIIYYLGFRAFRAPLLTLMVVVFGTVWCVGTMSLLGYTITVVSITTPPLVLTLGSSYSIHILNQYYREFDPEYSLRHGSEKSVWIADAVFHVNRTVLIAAATTIVGFMSLLATQLKATREFGIATSFGIAYCAILSFFLLPAMLSKLPLPSLHQKKNVVGGIIVRFMELVGRFVQRKRIFIFIFVAIMLVGFVFAFRRIEYETEVIEYFPQKEKVIQDTRFVADKIGGYQEFNLTLNAPDNEKNYFLQEDVLNQISELEQKLENERDITKIISFSSYLRKLNFIMNQKEEIPESKGFILLLSRYVKMLLSREQVDETVALLANEDFSRVNLSIWVYDDEKKSLMADESLEHLVRRIETYSEQILDPAIKTDLWGESLSYISLSRIIKRDQRLSTLLSFVIIFILAAIVFRSLRIGVFALIPLITGIMLNFIFMVLVGIPFDMTTVMFSIVVIGVGVDNAIHFLLQYRYQKILYPYNYHRVLMNTLKITGRPIIITTLSIVGGLVIFSFASFRPIIYFGLLVAMALFTAALGTIIVLPAILSIRRRKG